MNPRSRQHTPRSTLPPLELLLLVALLLFPTLASVRLAGTVGAQWVAGFFAAASSLTFGLYWHDKRRAQAGGWRRPESTLHCAEMIGGWPAAFLAQRIFRHKISKTRYQVTFWAIVAFHEAASFDFLHEWEFAQRALVFLR